VFLILNQSVVVLLLQKRAAVLDHRVSTGLIKKWKPALVVLTVDHFLHIFDLPFEVNATNIEITKETAFRAILPNPIDSKGRFKRSKDADRIVPNFSLSVDFCKARGIDETAFEVVESIQNQGFVKVRFYPHILTPFLFPYPLLNNYCLLPCVLLACPPGL